MYFTANFERKIPQKKERIADRDIAINIILRVVGVNWGRISLIAAAEPVLVLFIE